MQPRRELPDCDLLRNGDREVFPALPLKLEAAHLRVLLLLAGHHRFACPPLCAALGQLLLLGRGVAVAQLALGEVVVLLVVLLHLNLGRACPGINRHAALRTLARLLLLRRLLVLLLPALPVILPLLVPTVLLPALLALSTLLLALPLLVPAVLLACLPVVLPLLGSWLGSLLRLRRLLFLRLLRLRFWLLRGGARLLRLLFCSLLFGFPRGKIFVKVFNLILTGVVVEHQRKLLFVERGHALALALKVGGKQVKDLLALYPEVLRDLMHPVFFYHISNSSSRSMVCRRPAKPPAHCRGIGTHVSSISIGSTPRCRAARRSSRQTPHRRPRESRIFFQ